MLDPLTPVVFWIAAEVIAVAWLLVAIRRDRQLMQWLAKPAASSVFVAFGLMRADLGSAFDLFMVAGLVLGMAGDVLLIDRRTFRLGLLTFLAGHAAYIGAFGIAGSMRSWSIPILGLLVLAAVAAALWMWPHAGSMRGAVMAYIAIISVMAWGGISLSLSHTLPVTAGIGATLFFISDLAVARQRFIQQAFLNRAVGLPAYFAGQMLLALTIGSVG